MGDAYRDDLAAAQHRLRDLEREHAALAARNATLEADAAPKPVERKPVPKRKPSKPSGVEMVVLWAVIVGTVAVCKSLHVSRGDGKLIMLCVVLATQAVLRVLRGLREELHDEQH